MDRSEWHDVESVLTAVGVSAEILAVLFSPELVGLVAVGVFVVVALWAIWSEISCMIDTTCRTRFFNDAQNIGKYG